MTKDSFFLLFNIFDFFIMPWKSGVSLVMSYTGKYKVTTKKKQISSK